MVAKGKSEKERGGILGLIVSLPWIAVKACALFVLLIFVQIFIGSTLCAVYVFYSTSSRFDPKQ